MSYLYRGSAAQRISKVGIDLTLYEANNPDFNIVLVHVEEGHFEEFFHDVSTFTYVITSGEVTFFLNDERVVAGAGDMVVVPPHTRIYYFGTADMVLCTTPAWTEVDEHHVRDVSVDESPYRSNR